MNDKQQKLYNENELLEKMRITVLLNVMPCNRYIPIVWTNMLLLSSNLKEEAVHSHKTMESSTKLQCHIPETHNLHSHCDEKPISHIWICFKKISKYDI
jgi:hypothetical protein